jgi:histone acetyltransferase (RNA polymerase elongator complex component)
MKVKHYTIPVFVPELACPFRCIYCDQQKISGQQSMPGADEVEGIINKYLASFPKRKKIIEVGFFGGNFTGIPHNMQVKYLLAASGFLKEGKIQGIRLSTRPDYINDQVIQLLKKYNVSTVELGAQSMVEEVLLQSARGHTVADTINASRMIKNAGMRLGLQMMIGLPGDKPEYDLQTATAFVELGANDTRVYPTLVIRGTALEKLFLDGKYVPLEMDEAVRRAADVLKVFQSGGVRVIRMGLHPSEALLGGEELVAGPFHEAFRELVMTQIWADKFAPLMQKSEHKYIEIHISPAQFNFAIGHAAKNKKALLKFYGIVVFMKDENLISDEYHAYYH